MEETIPINENLATKRVEVMRWSNSPVCPFGSTHIYRLDVNRPTAAIEVRLLSQTVHSNQGNNSGRIARAPDEMASRDGGAVRVGKAGDGQSTHAGNRGKLPRRSKYF